MRFCRFVFVETSDRAPLIRVWVQDGGPASRAWAGSLFVDVPNRVLRVVTPAAASACSWALLPSGGAHRLAAAVVDEVEVFASALADAGADGEILWLSGDRAVAELMVRRALQDWCNPVAFAA